MDGPRDYHTEWNKSEKDKYLWYHLYMESQKMIQMNWYIKQKHTHREWTYGCGRAGGKGGEKIDWELENDMYTLLHLK